MYREIALDFVQGVLGTAAEDDGAGLGILAVYHVNEILFPELGQARKQTDGRKETKPGLGGTWCLGG